MPELYHNCSNLMIIFFHMHVFMYGSETVAEYIRGTAQVGRVGEETREARLKWFGHVRRKNDGYIGRRERGHCRG